MQLDDDSTSQKDFSASCYLTQVICIIDFNIKATKWISLQIQQIRFSEVIIDCGD